MADFQSQVMGLTGLTIDASSTTPSRAEFSTFLNDGVIDVTTRWVETQPRDALKFQRESPTTATNSSLDLNGAKIISVIREAGASGATDGSTAWRSCTLVPPSLQSRVVDPDSLHFASIYNPKYIVDNDGSVSVYPVASSNNGYKVIYVNNDPQETDGTALDHASTGIKYFPNDKVYLVMIYAAIKSLEAKMAEFAITEEDTELVQAIGPNLASLKQEYAGAFAMMAPPQQAAGGRR